MKKILSKIYNYAVNKRNNSYDNGIKKIHKCVSPVISIGNISVGGSGKTPFVKYLTCLLSDAGFKPCIVGKGYKRKTKGLITISDGKNILSDAVNGGDEMLLLAEQCKVPVLAHDIKYQGALIAESMFDIDCIIIDDGFQHRQLFRDIDILLIDYDTLKNPYLLPKGRLREPLSSITRSDVVCFIGDFDYSEFGINEYLKNKYLLNIKATPENPYEMTTKKQIKNLLLSQIITFSGIAKPDNFNIMVKALGYNCIKNIAFSDHHSYKALDIKYLINECTKNKIKYLATTEKDMVKIREFGNVFAENKIEVIIFPLSINIVKGKEEFNSLIKKVLRKG